MHGQAARAISRVVPGRSTRIECHTGRKFHRLGWGALAVDRPSSTARRGSASSGADDHVGL